MASLLDDLADDFCLRGIRAGQKLLFVRRHGDHVAKRDFAAHFAGQGFHLNRVAGRYPVLLCHHFELRRTSPLQTQIGNPDYTGFAARASTIR